MELTKLSEILRDNGIVGAGGAGFPTYGKLSAKAETILLNCAECEPLLKLHRQLLEQEANHILNAFEMVRATLGAKEAVIGVKEEYKAAIAALNEYIGAFPYLRIHPLKNAYPMGDEVVLIYEVTGKVVPPGGLPIECGIAVFNVETMYNIYRAVKHNLPVTEKLVTIAGEVEHPKTIWVPVGTKIKDAVSFAGKVTCENAIYLMGGPMMGNFVSAEQPITKTTSAIIVLPSDHYLVYKKNTKFTTSQHRAASACCQCETCTDLCPRHSLGHPIEPHKFMRAVANQDTQEINAFLNTFFCSSCGLCEMFSCPQGLNPRSMMATYKAGLRQNGVKPPKREAGPVVEDREYRRAPEGRLLARLGLKKYDVSAPLEEGVKDVKKVRIKLSQHIGAPAVAMVKEGDKVSKNDVIAKAAEGLSVNIHASITGTVTEVTNTWIEITK